eukprot:jgi/Tetstr1/433320/TSEL_022607.t1
MQALPTQAAAKGVNLKVTEFPDEAAVGKALNELVVSAAAAAIAEKGAFSLASPGGSIPKLLAALPATPGADAVDWSKVHLFFVNERQNEGKCLKLNKAQFADALGIGHVYPAAEGESIDSAAAYDATLRGCPANVLAPGAGAGAAPSLDMALIGLGNDGHIGSCYPNSDAARVAGAEQLALPVDMPGKQSITLSLAMMAAAKQTVVATCGAKKAEAIAAAVALSAESQAWGGAGEVPWLTAPAARLASGPGENLWLLDAGAASRLQ